MNAERSQGPDADPDAVEAGAGDPHGVAELSVGYVAGAHGIRGGLRVRLHDPDSAALVVGRCVTLRDRGERMRLREHITKVAPQPGSDRVRVWVEGVETREAAEALKGCDVRIAREELPELDEDEYYLADLIDLEVRRRVGEGVQRLGTIVGVTTNGVQDLFEVQWQRAGRGASIWLLPALPEFIEAIEADHVLADLPEGFLPTQLERAGER